MTGMGIGGEMKCTSARAALGERRTIAEISHRLMSSTLIGSWLTVEVS